MKKLIALLLCLVAGLSVTLNLQSRTVNVQLVKHALPPQDKVVVTVTRDGNGDAIVKFEFKGKPLSGVNAKVYNISGALVADQITSSDGYVNIGDVPSGVYVSRLFEYNMATGYYDTLVNIVKFIVP